MKTKCANFNNCQNGKHWDENEFFQSDSDVERIKIFLCDECYTSKSLQYWMSLKNGMMSKLKNTIK